MIIIHQSWENFAYLILRTTNFDWWYGQILEWDPHRTTLNTWGWVMRNMIESQSWFPEILRLYMDYIYIYIYMSYLYIYIYMSYIYKYIYIYIRMCVIAQYCIFGFMWVTVCIYIYKYSTYINGYKVITYDAWIRGAQRRCASQEVHLRFAVILRDHQ